MLKSIKHHLPLLSVLQNLATYDRQILVDHLDKDACDALRFCLTKVLQEGKKKNKNKKKKKKTDSNLITKLVRGNQNNFEQILGLGTKKKKNLSYKQKGLALAKIGGNPLAFILSSAIPLLLNLIKG